MASSQQPRGRGRGRPRAQEASSLSNDVSATAISNTTDVDISSTTNDIQTVVTSLAPTSSGRGRGRGRGRPRTQEASSLSNDISATAISNTTDAIQTVVTSPTTTTSSRGHNTRLTRETEFPDPHWIVSDLSINQFNSNDRPSKPIELGKIGDPITVTVNYFPITQFPQEGIVYQYDIKIQNKRDRPISREQRRAVYKIWLRQFRRNYPEIDQNKIVFDNQAMIFTLNQILPNINENGIIEYIIGPNRAGREAQYKIFIKQVGKPIDLSLLRALKEFSEMKTDDNIDLDDFQRVKQMLSIVLHEYCSSRADFIFDRSFFSQPAPDNRFGSWDLGLGKAAWRGFYSCLVFSKGPNQLLMNLDVCHRVFLKNQPFLDFLCEVMSQSPCGKRSYRRDQKLQLTDVVGFLDQETNPFYNGEIEFLLKPCQNLSVRSHVANKTIGYYIQGLGEAASRQTFKWSETNSEVTVENYYRARYGVELKYPTLPTLKMHNGAFVPMEFIDIKAAKMTKITDEQRALLCLKSSLEPIECSQSIKEVRKNPQQQCFEQDPFIAAWNLNIAANMVEISARILPMPDINCNARNQVTHERCIKKGVWNNTKIPFFKPTVFPPVWALINLSSMDRTACEQFYHELSNVAHERGIHCPEPVLFKQYDTQAYSIKQIIDALKDMMEHNDDCKFFIVILPEDNTIRDSIYSEIKELCELEPGFGIVTQMIKLKKNEGTSKWNYSRLNNILMKINNKLDGINSTVGVSDNIQKFFSKGYRTMYVGVDLSHGPAGSSRLRSTVAVVASVGDIPIRYLKEIYIQERSPETRGQSWEYVEDMKEIMKSLIRQYKTHQDYPPNAIVIYRDGIATSEFNTVFEKELTAIREACVELSPVYRPYLTYIVVNKRHHTRFFPKDSKDNVVAGTVVDSHDVTNPTTYDFFLNSHHGAKGTSRPAHYHVLYDDNKLQPDQVQMLTYALCCLHARCARSISIPAPVKYADLLAFRAGIYKNTDHKSSMESRILPPIIPINQEVNVGTMVKSKRIVLSPKLAADCPFFL